MALNVLKILVVLLLLYLGFYTYHYHYGDAIGGKKYQYEGLEGMTKIALEDYGKSQQEALKYTKHYNINLHKEDKFKSLKKVKVGIGDNDELIQKYCSDCFVSENSFKVAAYSKFEDIVIFYTVDSQGNFEKIKVND